MNGKRTLVFLGILLTLILLSTPAPSSADGKYNGAALEWTLMEPIPSEVETDESFTIKLNIKNEGTVDLTGRNKTAVEVQSKGVKLDGKDIQLMKNASTQVTFSVSFSSEGTYELKLNAYFGSNIVNLYDQDGTRNAILGTVEVKFVEEPFNFLPFAIIGVVVVIGLVGFLFYSSKKKKDEEAKRVADEARRQEMIRKKEEEIAKKIEVRQIVGKQPRDYYVLRRQKYAVMKPAGMTSGGLNILKRELSKAEKDALHKIVCPKCGTDLESEGADCPRCSASERIATVRHDVRKYKSQTDADFGDAEALLRKAEHRLNWSDYAMAIDLVSKAQTRMEEIWDAAEKGEQLESTVMEYSEVKGPSLDAKVISMEGEEAAMPLPLAATAAATGLAKDEGPKGEPCPECGSQMDDGECLICGFPEKLDRCWAFIEKGEMDGANMDEAKDLCRQANSAHERDNDELAVRYLRRALQLSKEQYHNHARSKTEGIIKFTNALVIQVKGMGEDVAMAEQMIQKADAALEEGDYEAARSMAGKADGYLKQLKEDSSRKRIGELMPTVEAGAATNPDVEKLLVKAKKLINANELEGAADLLEAAQSKL